MNRSFEDLDAKQKRIVSVVVIIALSFGAYFLRDYFIMIAFAAILAFLFNPLYKKLLKRSGKPGLASALTIVIAIVSLIIPLIFLVAITIDQAVQFIDMIQKTASGSTSFSDTLNSLISQFNTQADRIPGVGSDTLSISQINDWIKSNIPNLVNAVVDILKSFAGGLAGFFTKAIIFLFVVSSFFKNQQIIIATIKKLNPLGDVNTDLYLSRMGAMTTAMVKGQFTIAVLQGLTDAALMWITGIDYFFFWFMLLTFLSIIPLGGGIIVLPLGVLMLITGNIWQGLVLILGHLLIVTNIDNVLRPKFVPKSARLDPALTILSVFSGIAMFGFLGIVVGPVVMIMIVTTVEVYLETKNKKLKS